MKTQNTNIDIKTLTEGYRVKSMPGYYGGTWAWVDSVTGIVWATGFTSARQAMDNMIQVLLYDSSRSLDAAWSYHGMMANEGK